MNLKSHYSSLNIGHSVAKCFRIEKKWLKNHYWFEWSPFCGGAIYIPNTQCWFRNGGIFGGFYTNVQSSLFKYKKLSWKIVQKHRRINIKNWNKAKTKLGSMKSNLVSSLWSSSPSPPPSVGTKFADRVAKLWVEPLLKKIGEKINRPKGMRQSILLNINVFNFYIFSTR